MKLVSTKKLPHEGIDKILIRGTNWIGDAILTLPAVASIRATYPRAHIAVLAKPWVADIYKVFSAVDEIIIYENKFDTPTGVFRLARTLKRREFNAAILLQNAIEAAIIAVAAGIPLRAGYDSDARGLLLTHRVRRTEEIKKVHQIDYYLEMVKALGCVSVNREMNLETKISLLDAQEVLRKFIPETKKSIIGIAPGATYGPAKRWFSDRFAAVADKLDEKFSTQGILLGGKADGETVQEVQKMARVELINLAGKTTLLEAIYLISQCKLFISNDSGLMHIAGALNIPTVAIFGSTNPVTTSPVGNKSIIVRKEVSCSPCLKEKCPTDFRCMKLISVEDVLQVAQNLL
ncbi:MAG: lipopolysaccharide heptosyltransferase II [Deltaproteobacteria bacterium]|nr:lipopolysaccharide heptosyltransferase II [Deltaproteobacteria bacterium]